MSTGMQKTSTGPSGIGARSGLVKKVHVSSLRASSKPSKTSISTEVQSRSQITQSKQISKTLPLSERNQNTRSKTTTEVPDVRKPTGPPSAVKRNLKVPDHSGAPPVVAKSPAVVKRVTKPRSTTKRRKLPAHSGVPVSFSKRQAMSFLLLDNE